MNEEVIILDDDEPTNAVVQTNIGTGPEDMDIIDLVDEVSSNAKCINYLCKSEGDNVEMIKAPLFCLSFYRVKNNSKKVQRVCRICWEATMDHYSKLADAYQHETALFDVEMPIRHEMFQIDDSDSEEEDGAIDDVFIEGEALKFVSENIDDIIDGFDDERARKHIKMSVDNLQAGYENVEASVEEVKTMVTSIRGEMDRMLTEISVMLQPETKELDAINIVEKMEMAQSSPMVAPLQLRTQPRLLLKRQAVTPTSNMPDLAPLPDLTQNINDMQVQLQELPPNGTLENLPLRHGEIYYAPRIHPATGGAWVKVRLTGTVQTSRGRSAYNAVEVKTMRERQLEGCEIAYSSPANVRLMVGMRVLAAFIEGDGSGAGQNITPRKMFMFPGIVGEPLIPLNKHRYLIFFEDGYAQYVHHANVFPIYYSSKDVWDDINEESRPFIKKYLTSYPERPMVKLLKGQSVRTEYGGQWKLTIVKDIDCSLVQMSFGSNKRTEWIYRGSTRLNPLFKEEQAASNRSMNRQRIPRKTQNAGPYVQYTRSDNAGQEPGNSGMLPPNVVMQQQTSASVSQVPAQQQQVPQRSVARKSTKTTLPAMMNRNCPPMMPFLPAIDPIEKRDLPPSKIVYYKPRKQTPDPKLYRPHTCSPRCKDRWACTLERVRGYGPISKPLLCGFYRLEVRHRSKKYIHYKAPCGRTLRNMEEVHAYLRVTRSTLTVDLFEFDCWVRCLAEFQLQPDTPVLKDLSMGLEEVQIPVVNYIDNELIDFCNYSIRRNPMEGVNLNLDPDFLSCCDCTDDCMDKSKCSCWQLTLQCLKYMDKSVDPDQVGYRYRRLLEPIIGGIYECNSRCRCAKTCLNKVVQNGLQHKLQVFKTVKRGWGIRCLNDIPAGAFVCIYAGILLTDQMANEGGKSYGDEYLAELDYIECAEATKDEYEREAIDPDDEVPLKDSSPSRDEDYHSPDEDEDDDEEDDAMFPRGKPTEVRDTEFKPTVHDLNLLKGDDHHDSGIRTRLRYRKNIVEEKKKTIDKETASTSKDSKESTSKENADDAISISDDEDAQREPSSFNPKGDSRLDEVRTKKHISVRTLYGKDENIYIMDAKNTGNIGRFLNHSCSPNVYVQNVFVDTHDPRFPWVSFFAMSYIRAGTELTWNYNYDINSVPGKVLYCHCGSSDCKGRLL